MSAPPTEPATHVVVTGGISEAVDEVGPRGGTADGGRRLVDHLGPGRRAGCGRVVGPAQPDPTTPLGDLTDTNERCLRWSVLGVTVVALTEPGEVTVDHEDPRGTR